MNWLGKLLALGVAATLAMTVSPVFAQRSKPPKSELQKQIERESQQKRDRQRQQELKKVEADQKRMREWRQKYYGRDKALDAKADERSRRLGEKKRELQGQSAQKNTNRRGGGGNQNNWELQEDRRHYGTFGRYGYQGGGRR